MTNFDPRDIADNRFMAILCYFGPLLLIPLLLRPGSGLIRYHANQGLLLFIVMLVVGALRPIPLLGWLINILGGIFIVICLILGIVNCINGQARELPVIGGFVIIK